jgi:hypothetical protein
LSNSSTLETLCYEDVFDKHEGDPLENFAIDIAHWRRMLDQQIPGKVSFAAILVAFSLRDTVSRLFPGTQVGRLDVLVAIAFKFVVAALLVELDLGGSHNLPVPSPLSLSLT